MDGRVMQQQKEEVEPPRWIAALFRQHSDLATKVDAMAQMLQDIREEESVEARRVRAIAPG
jgi:hypothetical protein